MTQNTTDGSGFGDFGGSEAARLYREQLMQEGSMHSNDQAKSPAQATSWGTASVIESRTAVRKKINGRARVYLTDGGGGFVAGKMVDISVSGVCIMMDAPLPIKRTCNLECEVFYQGQRQLFSTQAVSVYGVLAGTAGFRVGFQFGARSPDAVRVIELLMS